MWGTRGPWVVLLHGFAQRCESWTAVANELAADHRVVALALPGHDPAHPPVGFAPAVADLAERLSVVAGREPVHLVGYSLGARLALGVIHTAGPRAVARATLIGVHPGLTDDAEREQRRAGDAAIAEVIDGEGIEAFERFWAAQPIFAGQEQVDDDALAAQRRVRLSHDPAALSHALRRLSLAEMPVYDGAPPVPLTVVVGARDAKFRGLAGRVRGARVVVVPNAGHNVPLEAPSAIAAIIRGG